MELRGIVERTDTPAGRLFDLTVQALIVISLISFSAETLPGLSEQAGEDVWQVIETLADDPDPTPEHEPVDPRSLR